jgi:heme/copper-type cytochrome/quinol oxidase subunit 2
METSALITMLTAWIVISFLMIYFLVKVLRTPMRKNTQEDDQPDAD